MPFIPIRIDLYLGDEDMEEYNRVRWGRFTLTCVAILVIAIVLLSISLLGRGRQIAEASKASVSTQVDSKSQDVSSHAQSSLHKICFLRGGWIYLTNLVTGEETKLVEGLSPALSPTGETIAFISVKENEGIMNRILPPPGRLTLLDVRSKKIREFKAMRDSRVGDPIWSNSGLKIAVTRSSSNTRKFSIAVFDPSTGDLEKEILGSQIPSDDAIYLDSWTPDDRGLLFHTLGALYEIQVDTGLVKKLDANIVFKSGEISSATQFHFSSDRRYLLFDRVIDTSNGPETEVSLLDMTTKSVRRVTPQGIRGRAAVWLPSNKEILFSRVEWSEGKWRSDICRMALDGSSITTLTRDADLVSFATK